MLSNGYFYIFPIFYFVVVEVTAVKSDSLFMTISLIFIIEHKILNFQGHINFIFGRGYFYFLFIYLFYIPATAACNQRLSSVQPYPAAISK